jgi:hypothetical protein
MGTVIIKPDGRKIRLRPIPLYRLTKRNASATPPQHQKQVQADSKPHRDNRATAGASIRRPKLQPIPSGHLFRVVSPSESALVTPPLVRELSQVLEQFAQANGFNWEKPLTIRFGRGTMGLHRFGRAADIYAVGGKGIDQWTQEWNAAVRLAANTSEPQERAKMVAEQKAQNLGYNLYKALQMHGGWAQPQGYPVQLFSPWTRSEGPHKAISDRMLYMHRDHIHVAK